MLLEIHKLTKTYRVAEGAEPVPVLQNLDLQVALGELVSIIGPSGTGKSTILNIVGALDQADSGTVKVEGRELEKMTDAELSLYRNTAVGFVFQMHHLLPQCSVLENVLVPTLARPQREPEAIRTRAEQLIASVGLQHRMHHKPGQLSGGERQRAAVARALINQPRLLLADEPTGALDRATASQLMDLLLELNQQKKVTILMVTHAFDLALRSQRVLELNEGKLVAV